MKYKFTKENRYIRRRLRQAKQQSREFYKNRVHPIDLQKIVFCCIEGTVGYGCNPKYICEEFRRRNRARRENGQAPYDLVWLADDTSLPFPEDVRVVKNTLANRAYELSTAGVWVDNSRKQLECRKRARQLYIQTWHAGICLKPIGLQRGQSFSRIAYLVSKHDSNMIDYVLSDAAYYEKHILPKGVLYDGPALRFGMPRCDILVNGQSEQHRAMRERYGLPEDAKIIMYAPTFRGGSQGTARRIAATSFAPDYNDLIAALEKRFGGSWYIFLRLHPQLTARHIKADVHNERLVDVSSNGDMYQLLAACDALLTDYSSVMFDAMVMPIPVFLYVEDLQAYETERGKLLWNLDDLPFPWAMDEQRLSERIAKFDEEKYQTEVAAFLDMAGVYEPGNASSRTADFIEAWLAKARKG